MNPVKDKLQRWALVNVIINLSRWSIRTIFMLEEEKAAPGCSEASVAMYVTYGITPQKNIILRLMNFRVP
jgi:hypothetical protein